jgi:hypothetical protein
MWCVYIWKSNTLILPVSTVDFSGPEDHSEWSPFTYRTVNESRFWTSWNNHGGRQNVNCPWSVPPGRFVWTIHRSTWLSWVDQWCYVIWLDWAMLSNLTWLSDVLWFELIILIERCQGIWCDWIDCSMQPDRIRWSRTLWKSQNNKSVYPIVTICNCSDSRRKLCQHNVCGVQIFRSNNIWKWDKRSLQCDGISFWNSDESMNISTAAMDKTIHIWHMDPTNRISLWI